jgi:hypothetical protein
MDHLNSANASRQSFQLWFLSLHRGHALCFPCDAGGTVALDELSEHGRCNYLYARAVVGREFAWPVVRDNTLAS